MGEIERRGEGGRYEREEAKKKKVQKKTERIY